MGALNILVQIHQLNYFATSTDTLFEEESEEEVVFFDYKVRGLSAYQNLDFNKQATSLNELIHFNETEQQQFRCNQCQNKKQLKSTDFFKLTLLDCHYIIYLKYLQNQLYSVKIQFLQIYNYSYLLVGCEIIAVLKYQDTLHINIIFKENICIIAYSSLQYCISIKIYYIIYG
ncbi:Hypothetical_protein [Hexamita inflata]|uniref:Hypothetical_protein n=1 Tax=Hexamita inflata TaxID=28002 RepID=A0AA86UXG7_9EUKA|nr:Hypothetical protein HINF_LOCUS49521 [Hexamita inflata]CAI9975820.1 Hypothetical protein HINF_LOCUS63465 [Hexamita inflata]